MSGDGRGNLSPTGYVISADEKPGVQQGIGKVAK
jgi:hypothetical protein